MAAMPVVQGTVVGNASGQAAMPANVVQGTVYRVDPITVQPGQLKVLQGLPQKNVNRKFAEIQKGATLQQSNPVFPESRSCRDALFILPFLAVVVIVIGGAYWLSDEIEARLQEQRDATGEDKIADVPPTSTMVMAGIVGAGVSFVAAMLFTILAQSQPACVVWTSLLFGPSLLILGGLVVLAFGLVIPGAIMLVFGLLMLFCVFFCWRKFIPFTIAVLTAVSGVLKENPCMMVVSLIGSVLATVWSIACGMVLAGGQLAYGEDLSENQAKAFNAVAVFMYFWGMQVAYMACHVTYCGVYGRWYYGRRDHGSALQKSMKAAVTTSFGSVCFGSFLIAIIRTAEFMVRQARRDAQSEGNVLTCVLLLVLECFISCIGDLLEYFSEWAYVQCAVRGVSFIDAARITYSMISCSNTQFILADLLLNSVVSLGGICCGIAGLAAGAGAGFTMHGEEAAIVGGVIGLFAGFLAGGTAIGILSSGAKTVLALWAEDPEPLSKSQPELHRMFDERIMSHWD